MEFLTRPKLLRKNKQAEKQKKLTMIFSQFLYFKVFTFNKAKQIGTHYSVSFHFFYSV